MEYFKHNRVLITGGCGFLGSSLAHRLVALGSTVTVLDSMNPLYGGNRFNIASIAESVRVVEGDVRDEKLLAPLVAESDIVFHFAAQVSYIDSLSIPYDDLDLNVRATLQLLELCRKHNRDAKVLFSSSRMVLGKIEGTSMTETTPTNPLSLYGIHKLASEKYLLMYFKDFGIPSVILRITNPYGPRQQIKHSKYSLVGWFVRQAMEDKTISIFGDGKQLRDYVYVDDIAEAFLRCAQAEQAVGQIVNIGSGTSTEFTTMVHEVLGVVGKGRAEFVPWPKDYEKIETGDVRTDISKLQSLTGWKPNVSLHEGIVRTFTFYRENLNHYL